MFCNLYSVPLLEHYFMGLPYVSIVSWYCILYIEEYNYFGNVIKLIINDMFEVIDCKTREGRRQMARI